jgi:hypothetical protein
MSNIDNEKLEKLMEEQKWDEARQMLEDFFASEMTAEEKGAVYVNMAAIYMKVMNKINEQYESALDDALMVLKDINNTEREVLDAININKIRKQIQEN